MTQLSLLIMLGLGLGVGWILNDWRRTLARTRLAERRPFDQEAVRVWPELDGDDLRVTADDGQEVSRVPLRHVATVDGGELPRLL